MKIAYTANATATVAEVTKVSQEPMMACPYSHSIRGNVQVTTNVSV